jgi:membrane-bound metal-dependent hydrolase YbcI (DUF457 family)
MFFFFHLFTGIVLGYLISGILKDRHWLIPCTVGAVLPDLIDKPLGFVIFGGVIDNGRIWCHSLLFAAIVLVSGLLLWKFRRTPVLIAAAIGILSHQLLDLMWLQPATWYYPLLGPFGERLPPGHLFVILADEISTPSEWVLVALIAAALLLTLRPGRIAAMIRKDPHMIQGILETGAVILLVLSGVIIGLGIVKRSLPYTGWSRPEEYLLGGIVIALAAYLLWRWQSRFKSQEILNGTTTMIK